MGLYYVSCTHSGLFYLGMNQIIAKMKQRKMLLDHVFSKFYTDPYSREGWKSIELSVGVFGSTKLVGTGATPSKPARQGDGQFTPYSLDKTNVALVGMYQKGLSSNIFKNSEDLRVEYLPDWDIVRQTENTMRWNSICYAYEVIEELVKDCYLLIASISPSFGRSKKTMELKTPAQLYFYGGDGNIGRYQNARPIITYGVSPDYHYPYYDVEAGGFIDSLLPYYLRYELFYSDRISDWVHGPEWAWYESLRSDDPDKDFIGSILNNPGNLWYVPIPDVTSSEERVQTFSDIGYQTNSVSLNEIGITNTPVISDITVTNPDDLPITISVDPDDFNTILINRGQYPILEEPVTFTVTYSVMLAS